MTLYKYFQLRYALHLDIDQIDDTILMEDLYKHFQEEMPYGTQKKLDGDPDEYML